AHKRVATPRPSEWSLLRSAAPSASSAACDHCAKFKRAPDEGTDAATSPASPCAVPWWRAIRARRYAGGHGTIRVTLLLKILLGMATYCPRTQKLAQDLVPRVTV